VSPRRGVRRRTSPERAAARRRGVLLAAWLVAGLVLALRAVQIQVLQGPMWRAAAEEQQRTERDVSASRGAILDRDGVSLALSHETFRIGVAPHELSDREATATILRETLGISSSEAGRITGSDRRWVYVPGRFPPTVREPLATVRGVYVERELRRFYPYDDLAKGLLGGVVDELGAGGIEQEYEDHLRGVAGTEMLARDSGGRPIPGETWTLRPPRSGGDVVLTIDASLQEIAGEALLEAVGSTQARGGDLVVTDPQTGEVLAMVSVRDGAPAHLGAINAPYEPGSTLKPFTVATLLRERRASLGDSIDTGNGSWTTFGRTITDVSAVGTVTLAHALRVSSNVGIAKAASRLAPDEQYEALRDFGFGLPTGVPLPGEASGMLRRPDRWSKQSAASLAIGYEVSVTPLQMALAYGALANGGVLMEPFLVRELRDERGRTVERFEPQAVRRVVSREIAQEISLALVEAVESGTGTQARLASFVVAGKSGTSRAMGPDGRYESGAYFSSFVGFFPAEDPQLVVFVKLERPQGAYYGGATAAPVTRATMEAILAARESPLDRSALAALAHSQRVEDARTDSQAEEVRATNSSVLFASLTDGEASSVEDAPALAEGGRVAVPEVRGLSARTVARRLHALGLRVAWQTAGVVTATVPRAGTLLVPGDTVRIVSSASALDPAGSPGEGGRR